MKKKRYSESQIFAILKEAEQGVTVADLCRKHGMRQATFYKWRSKYGGMSEPEMRRLKCLEEENRRLKQMYADLSLDHQVLKDVLEKKL